MTEQNNIWIVDLEAVESRYTGQWKHHFPELLKSVSQAKINVIEGPTDIPEDCFVMVKLKQETILFIQMHGTQVSFN